MPLEAAAVSGVSGAGQSARGGGHWVLRNPQTRHRPMTGAKFRGYRPSKLPEKRGGELPNFSGFLSRIRGQAEARAAVLAPLFKYRHRLYFRIKLIARIFDSSRKLPSPENERFF